MSLSIFASAQQLSVAQGTFTQIDFPGADRTQCLGINTAGDIVGRYYIGDFEHGFLLRQGTFTTVDYPAEPSGLLAINDRGQVVGEDGISLIEGFVYDLETAEFKPVLLSHTMTVVNAINNSGTIGGSFANAQGELLGFVATAGKVTVVRPAQLRYVGVTGITDSGTLIGSGENKSFDIVGFESSGNGFELLRIPSPTGYVRPAGITPAGDAFVGAYGSRSGTIEGFVDRGGQLQSLVYPGSLETEGSGINAVGMVVGYFDDVNDKQHGFVWRP